MADENKGLEAWQRWWREPPVMTVGKMLMTRGQYLDLLCDLDLLGHPDDDAGYWLSWLWWALLYVQHAICEELRLREPKYFETSYIWTPADKTGR